MEWKERSKEGVKRLWQTYGDKLFLSLAFLLVGVLCFEAGLLQKSLGTSEPVVIRVTDPAPLPQATIQAESVTKTTATEEGKTGTLTSGDCQFVGSKKSNKYHDPASRCAKQIKPENRRCFASVEAAQNAGYLPGCLTP
jgi:hypothetical protein